jgi:hypothetical protein
VKFKQQRNYHVVVIGQVQARHIGVCDDVLEELLQVGDIGIDGHL